MRKLAAVRKRPAQSVPPTAAAPYTAAERIADGKALRNSVPRTSHAGWEPPRDRTDPIEILIESSKGRLQNLIPIRYGRMLQTPFTFYRGAAAIMAADLATTPATGLRVQACGDCHLLNFGGFATPERRIIFDINDFDETLPAPWEWDLKRLATSFVIAGRNNRFRSRDCRAAALAVVRSYRDHMNEYAVTPALQVWYASVDIVGYLRTARDPAMRKLYVRLMRKQQRRDASGEFPKLAHEVRGTARITDDPPLVYHLQERNRREFHRMVHTVLERYRASLPDERRVLFDRYRFADFAIKVVGVGSVGTLCAAVLFLAADDDPLFLQIKEARESVLEPFAGKSSYKHRGERVVIGQRLMQAASDIFLGWTFGDKGRHFYMRQLLDVKIKPMVELMKPMNLIGYGSLCGWALARAHARSGDPATLAGYMGQNDTLDEAIADFAVAYADQNERDHAAMIAAARARRIEVRTEPA
jgi:uncharacterized protein (DUF2252 family)